jgi:hypothetical protein
MLLQSEIVLHCGNGRYDLLGTNYALLSRPSYPSAAVIVAARFDFTQDLEILGNAFARNAVA